MVIDFISLSTVNQNIRLVNSATYAMKVLQKDMANLAINTGISYSPKSPASDVMKIISDMRSKGDEL